jgi:conjugative relaxase-like TrwC/TraI family protein
VISMRTKGPGDAGYYTDVSTSADYYNPAIPGEIPGQWLPTRAAKAAGFKGEVSKSLFQFACNGFAADGAKMRQNAGKEKAQAFTDLTISDPKGVSVFEALVDETLRSQIQCCRDDAIRVVVADLENLAAARLGKAGRGGTLGGSIVAAAFKHLTSRALDVQSHTHLIVQSGMYCTDGKWRAIDWKCLYQKGLKRKLGALYRTQFAHLLQTRLGLELTRLPGLDGKETSLFDLKTMHEQFKPLLDDLSKRRAQVLDRLAKKGVGYSAKEAAKAALESRTSKGHLSEKQVRENTRAAARVHGLTSGIAARMTGEPRSFRHDPDMVFAVILKEAVAKLTTEQAHFTGVQVEQVVLEAAVCRGLPAQEIQERLQATFADPKGPFIAIGPEHARRFTTASVLAEERKLFSDLDRLKQTNGHECKKSVVEKVVKNTPGLTKEQVKALRHLVQNDGLVCVDGYAGTGKSRILKAAAECWRGYDLIGVAVAGKAAEGLEAATSIKSYTLAKLIGSTELGHRGDFEKGLVDDLKHHAKMLVRAAQKRMTWTEERVKLGPRSIVILDEAGMVGTKEFQTLARACARAKAKLVCVGDAAQLPPLGAGAPFRDACRRYGVATIQSIVRQAQSWHRRSVILLAHGRPERALQEFARRGLVDVSTTKRTAIDKLVANFAKSGLRDTRDRLALATQNSDVERINRRIQESRRTAGHLGTAVSVKGALLFQNDRVLFRKNDSVLGVKNGSFGTLVSIDERERYLKVRLDGSSKVVMVDLRKYSDLSLGYASSIFRSQGVTQDRVFVLGDGLDRQGGYVALSRSKKETEIFISKEAAGENLAAFAKSLKSDHSKTLATSQLSREQSARPELRL